MLSAHVRAAGVALPSKKKKDASPTVKIELIPPNATPEEREQAEEQIAAMIARIFLGASE